MITSQYLEINQSPCSLPLELFAEEFEKRGKNAEIEA